MFFKFNRVIALAAALLLSLTAVPGAMAARAVKVFEVVTVATESGAAATEAMRTALIRLTGRRDADSDPAFAGLMADARRYVQIARPVSNPVGLQVTLDSASIERAIAASGHSVWPRERPLVLVVLPQAGTPADATSARQTLQSAAGLRGLPIIIGGNSALIDSAAGAAALSAALAMARGQGADAALVAHALADGSWRWTLYTANASESYDGSLDAGIHGAADALARSAQTVLAQPEADAFIRVVGIDGLHEHALVQRAFSSLTGVHAVMLVEVAGNAAVYRMRVRGGSDALAALLAGSQHLRESGSGSGVAIYQYQP